MSVKTIFITGSTDGIGLLAARMLVAQGHRVIAHGRDERKLAGVVESLRGSDGAGLVVGVLADLSRLDAVEALARRVAEERGPIDVLINNAGVYKSHEARTPDGLDTRFAVNTIAPYLLTRRLLGRIPGEGRVVNLSSAAQASVNLDALRGRVTLPASAGYAQSKLALTAWTHGLAEELGDGGPVVVAVNPGSLLATKMVKQAFGLDGADTRIGADILVRAALSDAFASATGLYYDNDAGRFAPPLADATHADTIDAIVRTIEAVLVEHGCGVTEPRA